MSPCLCVQIKVMVMVIVIVIVIVKTLRVFVSLCSIKYPCFRAAPYQGAQNVNFVGVKRFCFISAQSASPLFLQNS